MRAHPWWLLNAAPSLPLSHRHYPDAATPLVRRNVNATMTHSRRRDGATEIL
ncbi:MAG: hypothetical protein IPK19_28945 [Chloroflexi bacterium]|nr:hypothetical protein [Chloroflexota bacterium]